MFTREEWLIGDKINLIKDKCVLIIGLGGVGGYALESLVRAGIGMVIIVDNDNIDNTNLNRQIISLNSNIGNKKVDEWEKRIKDINKDIEVVKYNMFVTNPITEAVVIGGLEPFDQINEVIELRSRGQRRGLRANIFLWNGSFVVFYFALRFGIRLSCGVRFAYGLFRCGDPLVATRRLR